ncbi:MAG: hypothetical protein K5705_11190 [Oscillospiraceae bacterium]|nr:hypothetical protein [Oscillospiraceae bacterium]
MDKNKEIRGVFRHQILGFLMPALIFCAPVSLLAFVMLLVHEPGETKYLIRHIILPLLLPSLLLCIPGWRKAGTGELTLKDGILSGRRQSFFRFQRKPFSVPLEQIDEVTVGSHVLEIRSGKTYWRFSHLDNARDFADEIRPCVLERKRQKLDAEYAHLRLRNPDLFPPRTKRISKQPVQPTEQAALPEPPQEIIWDDPFRVGTLSEEQSAGVFVPAEPEQKERRFLNGPDT